MLNARVEADAFSVSLIGGIVAHGLVIESQNGLHAEVGRLLAKPRWMLLTRHPHVEIAVDVQNLRMTQALLADILSMDKLNSVHFQTTHATFRLFPKTLQLVRVQASGNQSRVEAQGTLGFEEREIDMQINLTLAPSVVMEIPDSLRRQLLGKDLAGFQTFTVELGGSTDLPTLSIIGNRFHLKTRTRNL